MDTPLIKARRYAKRWGIQIAAALAPYKAMTWVPAAMLMERKLAPIAQALAQALVEAKR